MTSPITFEIPGKPKALIRHRDRKYGGKYDPSKKDKADFLIQSMRYRPKEPIQGAVLLVCVFWMPIPKATSKGKRKVWQEFEVEAKFSGAIDINRYLSKCWPIAAPENIIHIVRPDTDNLVKLVSDALNGVFWVDDSQVQIMAIKLYSEHPRTQVEIRW